MKIYNGYEECISLPLYILSKFVIFVVMNIMQVRQKMDAKPQADGQDKWLSKWCDLDGNVVQVAVCHKVLQQ
jgi:hypothetical protein